MWKKLLKVFVWIVIVSVVGMSCLTVFMRMGDEQPLDYSSMDFEMGTRDSAINGFTYLREYGEKYSPQIPDNYPVEYSDDYDVVINYDLFENWDLEFFETILDKNREFLTGLEIAFDRPQFQYDQELNPETLIPEVGLLRSYLSLRILEARVLLLSGEPTRSLERLEDLALELNITTGSGGALIGLLTNLALNAILAHEFSEFLGNGVFAPEQIAALAKNSLLTENYAEAVRLSFKQEFCFSSNILEKLSRGDAKVFDIEYRLEVSPFQIAWQRALLYFGFRLNWTTNDIYRGYADGIAQAQLPASRRNYAVIDGYAKTSEERQWTSFVNRNPYGQMLLLILFPSTQRVQERVDLVASSACATRISFGLYAYHAEHGMLPTSLEDLIPKYLTELPIDPFSGEPMRYSKKKRIVYSVGNDFIDQGGSNLPYQFQIDENAMDDLAAEHDLSEPTYPLRFAM